MSFEGYYQTVCSNGHYAEIDTLEYQYHADSRKCEICGEFFIWKNTVSTVNEEDDWGSRVDLTPDEYDKVKLPVQCVFCSVYAYDHGDYHGVPCCASCYVPTSTEIKS